jgi:hypothetical protein
LPSSPYFFDSCPAEDSSGAPIALSRAGTPPYESTAEGLSKQKGMINIAIQEDLPNALALVTRGMNAFLLGEPNQWVRCSDTEDPRMVHWSPAVSCEASVSFP